MNSIVQLLGGLVPHSITIQQIPDFNSSITYETTAIQRLATEPLGSTTLTLTNIVTGSRYRIERQGDGSLATPTGNAEGVAAASAVNITLDYYAPGSANNDLRIKVRKGSSAPKYLPFESQTTISAATQSVFVAQVADTVA